MLFEPLLAHASRRPTEIAVVDEHATLTWQQLAAMAGGLAAYLSSETRRERVGIFLPASSGFVVSFYASLLAGKTAVAINFLLGDKEIAHVIADSAIDTIITIPALAPRLKDARLKVIDLSQLPAMPPGITPIKPPATDPNAVAALLYTSGTSGLPKGVELTHYNILSDIEACIEHAQITQKHRFLGIIPLFHSTGLMATMIAPVQLGSQMMFIARFSPVATMNAIRDHAISVMAAVPSMYGALLRLKEATREEFKTLYAPLSGGEPLPPAIREGFLQRYGVNLLEGYGLTETCGPICVNVPNQIRPGSVGRPVPGASIRIDSDEGNALPIGETGEVLLKGPMIMKGYLNQPEATATALHGDGFFRTGDLGHVDPDGYLHITGRKKDLIIVAGEKAFPREIEDVLMKHPSVGDVAVVGKKDDLRGEVVVAFVIAKEGQTVDAKALRDHCQAAGLPNWKCPKDVIVVDDLPRSPTGKVLKRLLVEQVNRKVD